MAFFKFMSTPTGRTLRAVAGIALLVWAIIAGGWVWILGALGALLLAAGTFDFCPLAALAGKPISGAKLRAL